ncbi:MAG TPA: CdaR family protein [Bacillota bacterium]|nr:CdaR family protein [Bacillota bacterium]
MRMSNTFLKIASLIVAIFMWAYVIQVTNPTKTGVIQDVPVQLLNEESLAARGLALSGEANYTVDVKVEARKGDLTKLARGDFIANADLYGYSMGKNYIPVTVTAPDTAKVLGVDPIKINVVIEELVEVPKPIKVSFTGQFDDGIEAGEIKTQPGEILVSGAKSEVGAVAYIRAEVSSSKLSEKESTIQTKAEAVNNSGDVVSNVRLSSSYINVTAKLSSVKEVPLSVEITGAVAPIYEVTNMEVPDNIKIKGSSDVIAGITELTAKPVDISSVSNTSRIPLEIALPKGVEFANGYENLSIGLTWRRKSSPMEPARYRWKAWTVFPTSRSQRLRSPSPPREAKR